MPGRAANGGARTLRAGGNVALCLAVFSRASLRRRMRKTAARRFPALVYGAQTRAGPDTPGRVLLQRAPVPCRIC
jgi:hypothetical protein